MQVLSNTHNNANSKIAKFTWKIIQVLCNLVLWSLPPWEKRVEAGRRAQSPVRARIELTSVVARCASTRHQTFQPELNFLHVPLNEYKVITRVPNFLLILLWVFVCVDVVWGEVKMRSAWEAFCLLLLAVAAAAQIDTRHLSGQN